MKIRAVVLNELAIRQTDRQTDRQTERQTNRQTNKCRVKHNSGSDFDLNDMRCLNLAKKTHTV